jgi:hypothetical protein
MLTEQVLYCLKNTSSPRPLSRKGGRKEGQKEGRKERGKEGRGLLPSSFTEVAPEKHKMKGSL